MARKNAKKIVRKMNDEELTAVAGGLVNCSTFKDLHDQAEANGNSGWAAFYQGALNAVGAEGQCRYPGPK